MRSLRPWLGFPQFGTFPKRVEEGYFGSAGLFPFLDDAAEGEQASCYGVNLARGHWGPRFIFLKAKVDRPTGPQLFGSGGYAFGVEHFCERGFENHCID